MCFCVRSDGTAVPMEESAMVFEEKVRERDAGVYSCRASFYHHTATVSFLVEVMSDEKLFGECLHLTLERNVPRPAATLATVVTK